MSTNVKAQAAWQEASNCSNPSELSPQVEYAVRRIGGPEKLSECTLDFIQAYNESPVVDADLDTRNFSEILVRPLERKDGMG